ncbi:MAG TPA: glycosyltransferase family 4 protein [Bacteroidaceae bacterium]|nr:glycosyltransferase family 4 protein [Bacteroidaceae bacterium]
MNIAIICTLYYPYIVGGAEISTQQLAEGFVKLGHKVSVITTGDKTHTDIINGVHIYYIKNRNIYWKYPQREKQNWKKLIWHTIDIYNILYKKELTTLLKSISPDIIHTNNLCGLSTIVWNIAKQLNLKIVHTLRDYYLLCPKQSMSKGSTSCPKQCHICKIYSVPKKILSQKVDAVVGISQFILNKHLNNGYFQNAISKIIPNSIIIPHDYFRKRNNNTIGFLGRLSKEKGIEFLIQTFLKCNRSDKKLIIAGGGDPEYIAALQKIAQGHNNIIFTGPLKIYDFFNRIDLLVVPSTWDEPFGRVVIEAFSYQCPVFASNTGGLPELITPNVGRCFSFKDDSLSKLLIDFYEGKLLFHNESFDKVVSNFIQDIVTSKYINLYKSIIK